MFYKYEAYCTRVHNNKIVYTYIFICIEEIRVPVGLTRRMRNRGINLRHTSYFRLRPTVIHRSLKFPCLFIFIYLFFFHARLEREVQRLCFTLA